MTTTLTESPAEAATHLRRGELVAFPTETVYGLGADAFQPSAVRRIFEAKGRPADNPLIVHVCRRDQVRRVASRVPETAQVLMDRFAPGPLTVILPKHPGVPPVVTAGLETVGVRMPRLPRAQAFLSACDTPVPAPSANRSGRPSPTTWTAVHADLAGRIDCILKGARTETGVESTVVDCTVEPVVVLRPGAISVEAVRQVLGSARSSGSEETNAPRSPGTKHRHYAPSADVRLVETPSEAVASLSHAFIGLGEPPARDDFGAVYLEEDVEAYAHDLFHVFRMCDREGLEVIFAQTVPPAGVGRALNDRLRRAAAR